MPEYITAASVSGNMHVAMVCFAAGVMLIFIGWVVWKKEKPEYLPGYKKAENEDTPAFSRQAGQAHIMGGVGMLFLSFPLNEENPDFVFTVVMLAGCIIMVGLGIARYAKALKSRRK